MLTIIVTGIKISTHLKFLFTIILDPVNDIGLKQLFRNVRKTILALYKMKLYNKNLLTE